MSESTQTAALKGGEFLVRETEAGSVFVPEEANEEQQMIASMAADFLQAEILPNLDRIDKMEEGLMPSLLDKAGELGLLGTAVPEEFGGFGKDFITNMMLTEVVGGGHSFAVALAAHTGIGTLPILYFGNQAQKEKYLPKLATGEWKACYCLTEPGSGSDALAAKTRADLSEDGKHYVLNGQKMWITNAGFADVFVVFAQIDGDKFTGFIVEKSFGGLTLGEEEHKMGIKGSSTRQVFFENCKVPVENLLGEIGKGHKIAFNILNIGRAKLAAAALGGAKRTASLSVSYANEREQFKTPIARFGAMQHKLAEQAIRIFALESAIYRLSKDIHEKEEALKAEGKDFGEALLGAAEEYAIECAILKVFGSEMLDFVVDEGVQIYGGYGFSAEYPMDRAYRDSRINRIFEGTNEINRMLTVDMLLKRAMKGQIDLLGPAMKVQGELMSVPSFGDVPTGVLATETGYLANFKKAVLMTAGATAQKLMTQLETEQEVIMYLADMVIQTYVSESILLRVKKLVDLKGEAACKEYIAMAQVFVNDAAERISSAGRNAINAWADGDEQRMILMGLKRFTKVTPFNTKDARRLIASKLIDANKYCY
ncbi:MAG: acyl-CoA dehydrogenase family protein [Flavobacteriales bacterium]|nr:acyl-CoA dehydrogenase family protein [Flavobacteriales bacterium]MCB9448469.1 acyl-CoA dehydrogenase family protein [Flavobacteriales bacterium]